MNGVNLHQNIVRLKPRKIPLRLCLQKQKLKIGQSHNRIFITHVYCLTNKNAYFITRVNNHFYISSKSSLTIAKQFGLVLVRVLDSTCRGFFSLFGGNYDSGIHLVLQWCVSCSHYSCVFGGKLRFIWFLRLNSHFKNFIIIIRRST